ncbi:MAG: hypothetical protein A2Y76_13965 [Planctomycetes bacterium RBG_13_60_9]|nr:MAG: hypothetical protein A2Y76_13965 [Planctomycetes bacterium RBG_13_60_9]
MGGRLVSERDETEEVVERLTDLLDSLGVRYAVGGSIASSLYGTVRFTRDADITVQLSSPVADKLYDLLKDEFYVSRQAMEEALSLRRSFNIIHFETAFKVDLFVQGSSEFEQRLLERSRRLRLSGTSRRDVCVVSPEDIVLLKLRWFEATGGTSERQWGDVLGVLAVQGEALDFEYLTDSARKLGLAELLGRAIAEAQT